MKNFAHASSLLSILCSLTLVASATVDGLQGQAVITVPVLELNRHTPHDNADLSFPASPETKKSYRDHQALYNEHVRIVETNGDAVRIAFDGLIYDFDSTTHEPISTFWTYSKYLALLEQLNNKALFAALPHPMYAQEPTVVLTYPWNGFSVGTRFRHTPDKDTHNMYAIVRIDYTNNVIINDTVPHDCARIETKLENQQQARQLFVDIINSFLDRVARDGVVPFVWGGSSFMYPYQQDAFYLKNGVWHRKGQEGSMYNGYDASEFVMRMAQIAGINFPYKTTWTIEQSKKALSATESLEQGDLIWIPGGIMIVSSLENNEVVTAHGYTSGYGCVHRLPLENCFLGIKTYADLVELYRSGKPLIILDKQGQPVKTCPQFKLLKFIEA